MDRVAPLSELNLSEAAVPPVGAGRVIARAACWGVAIARFVLGRALDRVRGRADDAALAGRLRALLEGVGGAGLKIGQQLAVRVDLLPFEVCSALGELLDAVPPEPMVALRREVERALGQPVDAVFDGFGEEVLGAASIAVVVSARLPSGEEVAVKVRRPGVAQRMVADLHVVSGLTRLMEATTLVRPGHFRHLRADLWAMLTDELDLRKEADAQVRFRQIARDDGMRWLDAPEVITRFTRDAVLVTARVRATPVSALVRAVEEGDAARLAAFAAAGVHPARVAARVLELSQWSRLECSFFQADPHPGNLMVLPGDRLVVLDFGSVGTTSEALRGQLVELSRRVLDEDFDGAAGVSMAMLSPLPLIDLDALRYRLEHALWRAHLPTLVDDAAWWERTSISMWLSVVEVTRDFDIPGNPDVLRGVRANLLYDTLAFRLDPSLDRNAAIRRWFRRAARRARRRWELEVTRRGDDAVRADLDVLAAELEEAVDKGRYRLANAARGAATDLRALSDAVGYAVAQALHTATTALVLLSLAVAASQVVAWASGGRLGLGDAVAAVMRWPGAWVVGAWLLWMWYRRVVYRLRAREVGLG